VRTMAANRRRNTALNISPTWMSIADLRRRYPDLHIHLNKPTVPESFRQTPRCIQSPMVTVKVESAVKVDYLERQYHLQSVVQRALSGHIENDIVWFAGDPGR